MDELFILQQDSLYGKYGSGAFVVYTGSSLAELEEVGRNYLLTINEGDLTEKTWDSIKAPWTWLELQRPRHLPDTPVTSWEAPHGGFTAHKIPVKGSTDVLDEQYRPFPPGE